MTTTATPGEVVDSQVVDLVARAQSGDREAFALLYDRYVDAVFGYVLRRVRNRELAEDLTGDVFLRAYRRLVDFQWQGVDLGAWILTIARNRVHDHFKSARTRLERPTDVIHDVDMEVRADNPERIAVGRDLARALGRALDRLKDDHREVIELRFVHNLSVSETAEVLGRTVGATKALQYRALKALTAEVRDVPGLSGLAGAPGLTALLSLLS